MKVNKYHYEFDEVVEELVPTHDMVRLTFKKNGNILKKKLVDGMEWYRYRKYPSVIFNEEEEG